MCVPREEPLEHIDGPSIPFFARVLCHHTCDAVHNSIAREIWTLFGVSVPFKFRIWKFFFRLHEYDRQSTLLPSVLTFSHVCRRVKHVLVTWSNHCRQCDSVIIVLQASSVPRTPVSASTQKQAHQGKKEQIFSCFRGRRNHIHNDGSLSSYHVVVKIRSMCAKRR